MSGSDVAGLISLAASFILLAAVLYVGWWSIFSQAGKDAREENVHRRVRIMCALLGIPYKQKKDK